MVHLGPDDKGYNPYKGEEWARLKETMIQEIDVLEICCREPAYKYASSKEMANAKVKGMKSGYFNERGEDKLVIAQCAIAEMKHVIAAHKKLKPSNLPISFF